MQLLCCDPQLKFVVRLRCTSPFRFVGQSIRGVAHARQTSTTDSCVPASFADPQPTNAADHYNHDPDSGVLLKTENYRSLRELHKKIWRWLLGGCAD